MARAQAQDEMIDVDLNENVDSGASGDQADESGDNFVPPEDALVVTTGKPESGKAAEDDQFDPEVLAALAGEEKPRTVPHSRFNEVNEEAKAHRKRVLELEEELARAKGGSPQKEEKKTDAEPAFDFDAAEDLYATALLDGDQTKAKQIRAEIRREERAEATRQAETAADRRYAANKERDELARATAERDLAVAKAYEQFPFLDASGSQANAEAIEEVLALANLYTTKGKSVGESITAAVAKVGPRYAEPKPVVAAAAEPKPDLLKGLEREARIPTKTEGVGARALKLDVSKMTAKEMAALSPEDEARLAGDVL
jgi:hypothetical protein